MIKAYRLFTGPDGDSYVERGTINADAFLNAASIEFRETPAYSSKDLHTAPVPQYVIMLTGVVEFTTRGGAIFTTYPGNVLLVADTTGSGHGWRVIGDDPWQRACIVFTPDANTYFIASDV